MIGNAHLDYMLLQKKIADTNITMQDLPNHYMWSDTQFGIIKRYIKEFEASLDEKYEVGLLLTNFGQSILMQVTDITYEESVLLVFKGIVNERQATLIQHINQLSFLLTTIPKPLDKPRKEIGFSVPDNK